MQKPIRLLFPLIGTGALAYGSFMQPQPPPLGAPLPGLTSEQLVAFTQGREEFLEVESAATGLGPVFNHVSCVSCHRQGAPGGAGADNGPSRVTRIGGTVNGVYSDLANVGGALLQRRSLRDFIPTYPIPGEVIPPQATFVSNRITTPLFGNGLMEAIPDSAIKDLADPTDANQDGVSGRISIVVNPFTGLKEIGRFGWKSQVSSVHVFAADAYLNEMGITSPGFAVENLPQGNPIPPGADNVPDPEDDGTAVSALTSFMRLLAPPARRFLPPGHTGEQIFTNIRCNSCHTPVMQTGPNAIAALANREVRLYSDLLLHDMGPGLADGVRQGNAAGSEWRTAPLWGLGIRRFFLHDGRAPNIDAAIRAHGGEASTSLQQYLGLTQANRNLVLEFLGSL